MHASCVFGESRSINGSTPGENKRREVLTITHASECFRKKEDEDKEHRKNLRRMG